MLVFMTGLFKILFKFLNQKICSLQFSECISSAAVKRCEVVTNATVKVGKILGS